MNEREGLFRAEAVLYKSEGAKGKPLNYEPQLLRFAISLLLLVVVTAAILIGQMNYKSTVPVRGNLSPIKGSLKIHVPSVGRIESIVVTPGQTVQRGQLMAIVRKGQYDVEAESRQHIDKSQLLEQQQNLEHEQKLLKLRQADETESVRLRLSSVVNNLEFAKIEIELAQQQVNLSRSNLEAQERLVARSAIPKMQFDQFVATHLSLEQQLHKLHQQQRLRESEEDALLMELEHLPRAHNQQQLMLKTRLDEISYQRQQLELNSILTLVAPEKGIVTAITASEDQLTDPRQPLLYLSPLNNELEAVLYVPSRAVGQIAPGQSVLMSYDAFDYQNFGRYESSLTSISRNSVDPREHMFPIANLQEPVYLVKAKLDQQFVEGADVFRLQEGMLFTAEIVTAEMTLLEYLFAPLIKLRRKS